MKHIIAYIKPHKLSNVTLALRRVNGLTGMSISDTLGFGRGIKKNNKHNNIDELTDFIPHTRIDIFCDNEILENVIGTIRVAAHTGLRGDGKIYISNVENAVRISTGESGKTAI